MHAPVMHKQHPAFAPTSLLGGLVGTLLMTSVLYSAPALGVPLIDLPRLLGALFTGNPGVALGVGYTIFFFFGTVVFALTLSFLWPILPGDPVQFRAALLKGLVGAGVLLVTTGLLLPLLGALSQVPQADLEHPGFFGLALGPLGALALGTAVVSYGVGFALVAAMARAISPADAMGWLWTSHGSGESP